MCAWASQSHTTKVYPYTVVMCGWASQSHKVYPWYRWGQVTRKCESSDHIKLVMSANGRRVLMAVGRRRILAKPSRASPAPPTSPSTARGAPRRRPSFVTVYRSVVSTVGLHVHSQGIWMAALFTAPATSTLPAPGVRWQGVYRKRSRRASTWTLIMRVAPRERNRIQRSSSPFETSNRQCQRRGAQAMQRPYLPPSPATKV